MFEIDAFELCIIIFQFILVLALIIANIPRRSK